MYQKITKEQIEEIFKILYKEYPSLLKQICFGYSCEQICGSISTKIALFLREHLGVEAHEMSGIYKGRGTAFSGGKSGTSHCWVELWIEVERKRITIIIDGAYAQFYPYSLTPKCIKDAIRLMVFLNDKEAQRWYKGSEGYHLLTERLSLNLSRINAKRI